MNLTKFDTVVVKREDGSEQRLTGEAFAALAITERVRLVSRGLVCFLKDGQMVPPVEALRK